MAYDPNDPRADLRERPETELRDRPEVVNHIDARSGGVSWLPWLAILAVLLIGVFVWSNMGGAPGTDPGTTASTNPPAASTEAPAPAPMEPAAPAAPMNEAAPAEPAGNGG